MSNSPSHTLHQHQHHFGWSNALPPALRIQSGDTIQFDCPDASGGQIDQSSALESVRTLDFGRINPVVGPVFVEGAEAGDALKITYGGFELSGSGWTANIPGFGLLADQFKEPALKLWAYDRSGRTPALFSDVAKVPLKPFTGTIGLAPAAPGLHSIVPPRRVGGNLDVRDLAEGAVLYLPVETAGALLSVGDTHAAQGDGEVCGTAIESALGVSLTIELLKGAAPASPVFTTPGPVSRHLDADGYEVTTGIGPDLMTGAREALSRMIERLQATRGLGAEDAYMLCSVCGDLRISEIVNMPNWTVSFYFPRVVFS